jgi:hypothetical protein
MIRTVDGNYWLQTVDVAGRVRSAYCDNLGPENHVRTWCVGRGIRYSQVKASTGQRGRVAAASLTR